MLMSNDAAVFSNSSPNKDIDILVREDNLEVGKNCDVIPDDLKLQRSFVRAVRINRKKQNILPVFRLSMVFRRAELKIGKHPFSNRARKSALHVVPTRGTKVVIATSVPRLIYFSEFPKNPDELQ